MSHGGKEKKGKFLDFCFHSSLPFLKRTCKNEELEIVWFLFFFGGLFWQFQYVAVVCVCVLLFVGSITVQCKEVQVWW